jgi:hypothetical protein
LLVIVWRDRTDHGVENLRVGDGHHAAAGVEANVGDPDIGHDAVERAAERSGPQPDRITHLERPGQDQHQPGEHVAERLLCRDAEEDGGERPAEDELADGNAEQHEGDHQRGERAGNQERVPDNGGMRRAGLRLEQVPGLPGQAISRHGGENAEQHGRADGDELPGPMGQPKKSVGVAAGPVRDYRGGYSEQQGDDRLPRSGLALDVLDLRRQIDLLLVVHARFLPSRL